MALNHDLARQWIEQAADGILDAERQAILAEHLATCAACQAYAAELAELEAALSASLQAHLGSPQMSPEAVDQLVDQVKANSSGGGSSGGYNLGWLALGAIGIVLLILALLSGWFGGGTVEPDQPSATATTAESQLQEPAETTPTPSETSTVTATPSPTELVLIAVPEQTANCRYGNSGSQFDIADTLYEGEHYTPLAKGNDLLWLYFLGPVTEQHCWVYVENIQLYINDQPVDIAEVPDDLLPFQPYPPTPTPTPSPTETLQPSATNTPTATPTCTPRSPTAPKPNC